MIHPKVVSTREKEEYRSSVKNLLNRGMSVITIYSIFKSQYINICIIYEWRLLFLTNNKEQIYSITWINQRKDKIDQTMVFQDTENQAERSDKK